MIKARKEYINNCRSQFEEFAKKNPAMLLRYVKKGNNQKKGVIIVVKREEDDEPLIGWSLCRKTDNFNKYIGIKYAIKRAFQEYELNEGEDLSSVIPATIWRELANMTEDIDKKFKIGTDAKA